MSNIDVGDLASNQLPKNRFPVNSQSDFRVHFDSSVHRSIWEHAREDTSIEICGVLVGCWEQDENGPFVLITGYIRCDNAASKYAEVTFTHESWAQINQEMDSRFSEDRIVGWYHTHPDFGIFLSDRDCFIHEHFFSSPGQVALVVDPIRDIEGVFKWSQGKPTPMSYYWVGNSIQITLTKSPDSHSGAHSNVQYDSENKSSVGESKSTLWDYPLMLLSWLLVFLLGYFLAGQRTNWERNMLEQGVVAHYGTNNLMKIGLEQELDAVESQLQILQLAASSLSQPGDELTEEQETEESQLRLKINRDLKICQQSLAQIKSIYGLTDQQRELLLMMFLQKQMELKQRGSMRSPPRLILPNKVAENVNTDSTAVAGAPKEEDGEIESDASDTELLKQENMSESSDDKSLQKDQQPNSVLESE